MGIGSSTFGDSMKRLVSPQARKAHQEQQARIQERIANAKEHVLANRRKESQQVNALLQQVQDEVNLEQQIKLEQSLPKVPRYQPPVKTKLYQRR